MYIPPGTLRDMIRTLGLKEMPSGRLSLSKLTLVEIPRAKVDPAWAWCYERFGLRWIWSTPFQADYSQFWFESADDALMFSLTWAGADMLASTTP